MEKIPSLDTSTSGLLHEWLASLNFWLSLDEQIGNNRCARDVSVREACDLRILCNKTRSFYLIILPFFRDYQIHFNFGVVTMYASQ